MEICIDPYNGIAWRCSGFLPIPNYMVSTGSHLTNNQIPSDLSNDQKCRLCNLGPASSGRNDECVICHRMPCKLQCRSTCPPCEIVICSDCAPNHNKTCPRSRNDRDDMQGKLTISYPDFRND
eukprot:12045822-Karenia_brevis.AAC.1